MFNIIKKFLPKCKCYNKTIISDKKTNINSVNIEHYICNRCGRHWLRYRVKYEASNSYWLTEYYEDSIKQGEGQTITELDCQ